MKSMKMARNNKNRNIAFFERMGVFAVFLLFTVFSVYLYSPVILSHADSEEHDFKLAVGEVVTLTVDNTDVIMNANHGSFVSDTINVTSGSNSIFGYTLTIADDDDDTRLTHSDVNTEDALLSDFSGKKTSDTMDDNTWGFSLNGTDYMAIPANDSAATLKKTYQFGDIGLETTAITFGVKVGSIASGSYSDSVVFTAYVNGQGDDESSIDNVSFYNIQTLQQMKPGICSATTTPLPTATEYAWEETDDNTKIPRTILIDARDGKKYVVEKLADGNCWMAQNLALDLYKTIPLTNKTTDLNSKSSWTPENNTSNDINVFDGSYCYRDSWLSCGYLEVVGSDPDNKHLRENSYRPDASMKYLRDGITPSSTPSTDDGKSNWESTGNYYNWAAATAGSGKPMYEAVTGEDGNITKWYPDSDEEKYAADSICPKGWRLPKYNSDDYESSDMFILAGVYDGQITTENIYKKLGFVASGFIHQRGAETESEYDEEKDEYVDVPKYIDAYFEKVSEKGIYHTSTINDYYYAENVYFTVSDYYEGDDMASYAFDTGMYDYNLWSGAPVRCLAR